MIAPLNSFSRRALLGASGTALLASPRLGHAQATRARTLRFVPQADLAVLDPVFTTASVTANHGFMVFDTLYGWAQDYEPSPQMVAGHVVEDDGLTWIMTLRDGLKFHDGEPVRGRDAVASIKRWGARDMFGQEVIAVSNEIDAPTDKTIRFRLKRPFPRLPMALGKSSSNVPVIMPERLAQTSPTSQVTEMVGSGPYRFLADERMTGARVAYARFEGYVPCPTGTPSRTAGPKIANFDRVEWIIIPDQATAASAVMSGEVDWVESTSSDLAPMLQRSRDVRVSYSDDLYQVILRFNHLHAPFDKVGVRRALLGAISQEDMMQAGYGTDPKGWNARTGVFTSDSPLASDAGLGPMQGKRDYAKVKQELAAAGYNGEKVVMLQADDYPTLRALAEVSGHVMRECGMNVETQSGDWGTVSTRRANKEDVTRGGWSAFVTGLSYSLDPSGHLGLRANGAKAWFGWPESPQLEKLRQDWFAISDPAELKRIGREIQTQAMQDVPYIPLGEYRRLQAARADLSGFPAGGACFWGVKRG